MAETRQEVLSWSEYDSKYVLDDIEEPEPEPEREPDVGELELFPTNPGEGPLPKAEEDESDNNSESSSSSSESSNSEKVKGLTKKYIEVINGSNLTTSQKKMAVGALTLLYALTGVAVADSAATDVIRGLRILKTGDCKSVINKYAEDEKIPCNVKAILIILRGVGVGSILPNIINDIVELTVKPTVKSDELGGINIPIAQPEL